MVKIERFLSYEQKHAMIVSKIQNNLTTLMILDLVEKILGTKSREKYQHSLNTIDHLADIELAKMGEKKPKVKEKTGLFGGKKK